MNKSKKPQLVLSGILEENSTGRFTAYFEEFPDVVAEGDNEDQAKQNLIEALIMVAQFKVKQRMNLQNMATPISTDFINKPVKHFHQPFGQLQPQ